MISFKPLFDFMFYNKIQMKDLQESLGMSPRTTAKFRKGESVSLKTIEKICLKYNLPIEDVIEILPDEDE